MKKWILFVAALVALGLAGTAAPAFAGECTTVDGEPRECTATEEFDQCLEDAVDAAEQRAEEGEGSTFLRFIEFTTDVAACTADLVNPLQ